MEDEGGVKAPVTRLRRRLSVEQTDDTKSSSASNTPTKKRGGRRAAKPELDLIDENAPENDTSKKLTKKTKMNELEAEEKPGTPSRRSARIKSNTSIVLETTQAIDSPRAKRASRRNSQVGSDNEAPLTPARQTRRTRRDSANADKAEPQSDNKPVVAITEIIIEEPETYLQKPQNNSEILIEETPSNNLRKSPRLSLKKNNRNVSMDENENEKNNLEKFKNHKSRVSIELNEEEIVKSEEHNNSNKENEASQIKGTLENLSPSIKLIDINNIIEVENNSLSISNDLLDKVITESTRTNKNLNKSSSAIADTQNFKHKRHRTKSWTALADPAQNDSKCYSDSESLKKKKQILNVSNNSDAQKMSQNIKDNKPTNKEKSFVHDSSINEVKTQSIDSMNDKHQSLSSPKSEHITSSNLNLFNKEPTNDLQTLVYIEESDSNSEKIKIHKDESVPIVETHIDSQKTSSDMEKTQKIYGFSQNNDEHIIPRNESCEPMDIDETLPDNSISNKFHLKTMDMSENKETSQSNDEMNCSVGKKGKSRKSSETLSTSQTLDKTTNENKSTLVLSQLKDISNENNTSQSPQISAEKKLLNSNQALSLTQGNDVDKKNNSSNYLTSTPLQQKSLLKHAIPINTSGINSNNTSKIEKSYSKLDASKINKSNKSEDSNDESSREESNLVDDEAEEASDDYESGDSRSTEEAQYERDHEIIQKGETLTSEDELSNDSDYEKDSFVISSDQEDDDLLDGSGDDLSMSDNELKMTSKSKKKYNERKLKEQKKASREMFASRHKLNVSNERSKAEMTKIKKNRALLDTSESEEENTQVKIKKNKRMRLDSSPEISINKSLENVSNSQFTKNSPKSLDHENDTNEVEMTVIEDNIKGEIDPLTIDIKKEPKTPQKQNLNTSIQFLNPEQSDNQEGNTNKSLLDMSLVDDPLQDSDTSESSTNNVHIENYDSVLKDLNKSMKTKKNKSGDISLNIEKKPKQKSEPIVDQLNLTQIKLKNKKQSKASMDNIKKRFDDKSDPESKNINESPKHEESLKSNDKSLNDISKKSSKDKSYGEDRDNESSASIDLHLLFSEDSNNSEDVKVKDKNSGHNNEDDSFIPLKKSHGKTNIFDTSGSNDKSHTDSKKTKKRNKKKQNQTTNDSDDESEDCVNETEIQFFVDTTGTLNSTATDKSLNSSVTKKKTEKQIPIEHKDTDSDVPIEVINKSAIEVQGQPAEVEDNINTSLAALDKSKTKTPKSDKKKKRASESLTIEQSDITERQPQIKDVIDDEMHQSAIINKSINKSISKTPKSEKKKSKRMSKSQTADEKGKNSDSDAPMELPNKSFNIQEQQADSSLVTLSKSINKTPKSDKKKILKHQTPEPTDDIENQPYEENIEIKINQSDIANKLINKSMSKTPKSEKKKVKKMSESQPSEQTGEQGSTEEPIVSLNESTRKEKDIKDNIEEQTNMTVAVESMNKSTIKTPKSDKKKNKVSEAQVEIFDEITTDANHSLLNSSKKQKFNKNVKIIITIISEDPATNKILTKTSSSDKKKKEDKITESNDTKDSGKVADSNEVVNSKKRKRKSSLNQADKEPQSEEHVPSHTAKLDNNVSITTISQNKKRKTSHTNENSATRNQAIVINMKPTTIDAQPTQNIVKQKHLLGSQLDKRDTTDVNVNIKKGTTKRKEREDDDGNKFTKILKVDNDKINVPRLPESILNQLEDRPTKKIQQVTKPKAISTTSFVVEEAKIKKTKPSNYLEESIYLNEEEVLEPKKQKRIKNPKVLPSLPTVSTSISGYTTNFKVNILPKEIKFVAKSTSVNNYKNDYLQNKKIKRLGTYELYKRNRNVKMSKF